MDNEDRIVEYLARMCIIIIFGLIIATILTLCSCTRTIYVPQISVERDSVYITQHSRDSIHLHDSILIREKGDTVWMERWHTQYVERLRVDTTTVTVSDTIREPYPVEKPLTWAQRTWINVGKAGAALLGGTALALLAYFLSRRKFP